MAKKKGPGRVGSAFHDYIKLLPPALVEYLLVIDPGFKYCGLAVFARLSNGEWICTTSWKLGPFECIQHVQAWLDSAGSNKALVIEEFKLYPWAMEQQGFSSMGTPEVIGVLLWLYKQRWDVSTDDNPPPALCMQGAHWKKPAETFMTKKGVGFIGPNQHARDAELHGWAMIDRLSRPASRKRANKAEQEEML